MPLRRVAVPVAIALAALTVYAGTAAAGDHAPKRDHGISISLGGGPVSVGVDVSTPTPSSSSSQTDAAGPVTASVAATVATPTESTSNPVTPAADSTQTAAEPAPTGALAGATGTVQIAAVQAESNHPTRRALEPSKKKRAEAPSVSVPALARLPLDLHVRVHAKTPLATADVAVGTKGATATAEVSAPPLGVGAKIAVRAGTPAHSPIAPVPATTKKHMAVAPDGRSNPGLTVASPAAPVLPALVPAPRGVFDRLAGSESGAASGPLSLDPRPAARAMHPASPLSAFDPTPALPARLPAVSRATRGRLPSSERPRRAIPAPQPGSQPVPSDSRLPLAPSGGAGAGIGFAAGLLAALSAFIMLVAPSAGRWLRPDVTLARAPAFASLLERPG